MKREDQKYWKKHLGGPGRIKIYNSPHYMIVMSHKYGSFGIQFDEDSIGNNDISNEAHEKGHNLLGTINIK